MKNKPKTMLEFNLKNGSLFKSIFSSFINEISDCILTFDVNGMKIQSMDSSHVSLVHVKLAANEVFNEYKCTEKHSLGVSVVHALKILKLADNKTKVTFQHKDPKHNQLTIGIVSGDGKLNCHFELNLMDIDSDGVIIPDDMSGWFLEMDCKDVIDVVKTMSDFGDSVEFCAGESNGDELLYHILGDQGKATGKVKVIKKQWVGKSSTPTDIVNLKLSMRHLKSYLACRDLSDIVTFFIGNDTPLCITFKLGEQSLISFYIAPKIDDE